MMEAKLFDKQGKETGTVELADEIFNVTVNKPLLWESITTLLRNERQGSAHTKSRAEVRGGGRKPWRQKGTGLARHGSIRSPLWKGGGVVFGPKPRDYSTTFPQKKRLSALRSSLSAKAHDKKIVVIEDLHIESPKTKSFVSILKSIKVEKTKTLIGTDDIAKNLKLASRNVPNVTIKRVDDLNSLDVLSADCVVLTKQGLDKLEKRCSTTKS